MRLMLPAVAAMTLTAAAAFSMARGDDVRHGDIVVTSAWARATPPGVSVGAAYVALRNDGPLDDRLISAASPAAETVTLHHTAEENGAATMRPLADTTIPAGGVLEMEPGGPHLMLMDLSAPMKEGTSVPVTLVFEKAGTITVPLDVAPIGAEKPTASHEH
jgi:copper(I)-binding protein